MEKSYIGYDSCIDDASCYRAFQSTIHDRSCHGVEACRDIFNVEVMSGACRGASSCKGYQSTTVYNRRMLTTDEEEEEEDTSPPTKFVIPADTCVGDGSCEDCQYLLEKFPGRCNNELSPSDVSTEHGSVCKLCRPLGSDDFEIDLPTGGDCEWVQGHIARALENTLIRNAIKEYSQELGPLKHKLTNNGEGGTCRVTLYYNPNPSEEDDADVLARIKTSVREIVKNEELMDILQDEFPNIYDRISRIRIKDGQDDGDSTQRSKSKKAKEPKEPKRAKRNKSAKEKRNMDIFE